MERHSAFPKFTACGRYGMRRKFVCSISKFLQTLGNHEFDDKIAGVVPFLEHITSPIVVSNIDDSLEPDMQGKYNKSTIVVRNGRKIGIVGVILSATSVSIFLTKHNKRQWLSL